MLSVWVNHSTFSCVLQLLSSLDEETVFLNCIFVARSR